MRYSPFSDMACVYRWLATSEPRTAGSGLAVGEWTTKQAAVCLFSLVYGPVRTSMDVFIFRAYLANSKNCVKVTNSWHSSSVASWLQSGCNVGKTWKDMESLEPLRSQSGANVGNFAQVEFWEDHPPDTQIPVVEPRQQKRRMCPFRQLSENHFSCIEHIFHKSWRWERWSLKHWLT